MAALALSLDAKGPQPPLVAARRGDAPIKQNAFSRWKYRQVDRFVCSSETVRRALVAAGIEDGRTVVVHDGLDLAHVDAALRADVHAEFWLPHRAPVVGAVGPLVAHKAYHDLVDAIAILRPHLPDVHLVIVGEGELRASVERQVRHLRLEKHVVLEIDPRSGWPILRLQLEADGRCSFVGPQGCTVYDHRPTCCHLHYISQSPPSTSAYRSFPSRNGVYCLKK